MPSTNTPWIRFPEGSFVARLCRREKRFRVEVETEESRFWVHCNNSGSMLGLLRRGTQVFVSPANRPGRTLPYTLELIRFGEVWVGVNTLTPNRLLRMAWKTDAIPEMRGYNRFRSEVTIGDSRLDACLEGPRGSLWIEAKNVTLLEDEVGYFPDAVSDRAQKHLRGLIALTRQGMECACFYLIQRADARCFGAAHFIDPAFGALFEEALNIGVGVWPYTARVSPEGIGLGKRLPISGIA